MKKMDDIKRIKKLMSISLNENNELDSYQPNFTFKDFVEFVESEFDAETLQILQNVIENRLFFLSKMTDFASRKSFKGFENSQD